MPTASAEDIVKEINSIKIMLKPRYVFGPGKYRFAFLANFDGSKVLYRDPEVKEYLEERFNFFNGYYTTKFSCMDDGRRVPELEELIRWCVFNGYLALPTMCEANMLTSWYFHPDVAALTVYDDLVFRPPITRPPVIYGVS